MTPCDDKTVITPRNVQLDTLFSAETRGYGTVAQRTGSKILIKIRSAAEPTILVETAGTDSRMERAKEGVPRRQY